MIELAAIHNARDYFLRDDHLYGCAETTYMVLKESFDLPAPADSSAALALNGGVARSGGICGVITGSALAIGMLAEQRIPDHKAAKYAARLIVRRLIDQFLGAYQSVNCRDLIGLDISDEEQHHIFLENGIWRTRCTQQIEAAILELSPLRDDERWEACLKDLSPANGQV